MKLSGKVALITGAARGIGRGIAEEFLREGAIVALNDVDEEKLSAARDELSPLGEAADFISDVTDWRAAGEMVEGVVERFGKLDVVVNNAAVSHIIPTLEMTEEVWNRTLDVNLKGAFIVSYHALRHMAPQKSGRIINMSSQSGKVGTSLCRLCSCF